MRRYQKVNMPETAMTPSDRPYEMRPHLLFTQIGSDYRTVFSAAKISKNYQMTVQNPTNPVPTVQLPFQETNLDDSLDSDALVIDESGGTEESFQDTSPNEMFYQRFNDENQKDFKNKTTEEKSEHVQPLEQEVEQPPHQLWRPWDNEVPPPALICPPMPSSQDLQLQTERKIQQENQVERLVHQQKLERPKQPPKKRGRPKRLAMVVDEDGSITLKPKTPKKPRKPSKPAPTPVANQVETKLKYPQIPKLRLYKAQVPCTATSQTGASNQSNNHKGQRFADISPLNYSWNLEKNMQQTLNVLDEMQRQKTAMASHGGFLNNAAPMCQQKLNQPQCCVDMPTVRPSDALKEYYNNYVKKYWRRSQTPWQHQQ